MLEQLGTVAGQFENPGEEEYSLDPPYKSLESGHTAPTAYAAQKVHHRLSVEQRVAVGPESGFHVFAPGKKTDPVRRSRGPLSPALQAISDISVDDDGTQPCLLESGSLCIQFSVFQANLSLRINAYLIFLEGICWINDNRNWIYQELFTVSGWKSPWVALEMIHNQDKHLRGSRSCLRQWEGLLEH